MNTLNKFKLEERARKGQINLADLHNGGILSSSLYKIREKRLNDFLNKEMIKLNKQNENS